MTIKKLSRHLKLLTISCIIIPFLTGCWDRLAIEERATILAIGIDKTEIDEDDENYVTHLKDDAGKKRYSDYRITVQIAIPGRLPLGPGTGGAGKDEEDRPVWVLEAKGHTLDDALAGLQQQIEYRLFLGHLRVIVVSEEIAREGLKELSDSLRRNSDVRRAAWLIISKEEAAKYMQAQPELERVPAIYIMNTMEAAIGQGKIPNDFIGIFWSTLSSKGEDPYLPYVELKEEDNIKISGLAYFKGEKMAGVTTPLQIGQFMAIKGINPGGYKGLLPMPEEDATVMIKSVKRKSKMRVEIIDGKPQATVSIHLELDVSEKSPNLQLDNSNVIQKIEEQSQSLKTGFTDLIKSTQEAKSDIFGFGEYVRAKHPHFWDREVNTKENWRELYPEMPVDLSVSFNIRRVGMKAR